MLFLKFTCTNYKENIAIVLQQALLTFFRAAAYLLDLYCVELNYMARDPDTTSICFRFSFRLGQVNARSLFL